jgi:hypothetical protein
MLVENWADFWWSDITGPSVVVSAVVNDLLSNANVVLQVPSDLPWRHSMRSTIQSEFRNRNLLRDIIIEVIDAVDDNPSALEPGKLLLEEFADDSIQRGYREKSKISLQEYICQKDILQNRIVWVKGLSGASSVQWIQFCKGLSPKASEGGLFVLEIHGDAMLQETKKLRVVNYNQYISNYDVQLLNSFILDSQKQLSDVWKRYISTVVAVVCNTDAEVSDALLSTVDLTRVSITEALIQLAESADFERRGQDSSSEHILKYLRSGNSDEIERRIWSAQVQILFPIIELERVNIVSNYQSAIKSALEDEPTSQYGKKLSDPIEVELGTLCYLMTQRKKENLYSLYIPDETDRNRIRFLHECRNRLAHAESCTLEQVTTLLSIY